MIKQKNLTEKSMDESYIKENIKTVKQHREKNQEVEELKLKIK